MASFAHLPNLPGPWMYLSPQQVRAVEDVRRTVRTPRSTGHNPYNTGPETTKEQDVGVTGPISELL